jgi:hypothetical protein
MNNSFARAGVDVEEVLAGRAGRGRRARRAPILPVPMVTVTPRGVIALSQSIFYLITKDGRTLKATVTDIEPTAGTDTEADTETNETPPAP